MHLTTWWGCAILILYKMHNAVHFAVEWINNRFLVMLQSLSALCIKFAERREPSVEDVRFDIGAYLHRIGMEMPLQADLDTLKQLTRAHLLAVPFENMAVCDEHKEPSLEPEDLFAKVVGNNRGGYCFELNK